MEQGVSAAVSVEWEPSPVNKLARVAAPACICLKSSYSRNCNTLMANWAKIEY